MADRIGHATWLTPISEVHERRFGKGTFPFPKAGRFLKPLREHHTPETIAAHYERFLADYDPRFPINYARFAETFGQWAPQPAGPLVDERGMLTPEGERATRPRGN